MTEEEALRVKRYFDQKLEEEAQKSFSCSYLDKESRQFEKGLTITTFYLAKGLEFDQVFALCGGWESHPLYAQARYIMATRALHELFFFYVDTHIQG